MPKIPAYLFKKIYQKGKIKRTEDIILRFHPNNRPYPRFGFVISAKDVPKATDRNKIKRRAKELAREAKTPPGLDFVFIFKKDMPFEELKSQINKLLND